MQIRFQFLLFRIHKIINFIIQKNYYFMLDNKFKYFFIKNLFNNQSR